MTERVLVVGGTGCVGRHVCAAFSERGAEVLTAARRHVPDAPGDRFVPLDLLACAGGELAQVLAKNKITTIVNAVLGWGSGDEEMAVVNVRPVERILDALRRMPSAPRLVQLGTVHEYGPMAPGTSAGEDAIARPANAYGRVKLRATRLVVDAVRTGSVDAVVLRLTNTVGPRPALESFFGSLAVRLRDAVRLSEGIAVVEAHRDYVDVRDAAAAVVLAARTTAADPLVNIGSGNAYSIRRLVDQLVAASGLPAGAVRVDVANPTGQSGSASPDWVRLDNRRARETLGWRPRYDIAESLRDMYDSVG